MNLETIEAAECLDGLNTEGSEMPTYEYSCDGCGATLERWQRFQDSPLTECPSCGGRLHRLFSAAPVIFKGSGWYSTDSRSKKAEGESSAHKPEPAGASA